VLILFLFVIGLWKWDHIYTSTATILSGVFLLYHLLFISPGYRGRFYLAYIVSCIPFLLVNGVLTGGFTKGPVVMYNPEEYFGIRVGTVPVDDFAYSFLMLFANITLFEAFSKKTSKV
jgi:lycopene cyclase domain-containing protein